MCAGWVAWRAVEYDYFLVVVMVQHCFRVLLMSVNQQSNWVFIPLVNSGSFYSSLKNICITIEGLVGYRKRCVHADCCVSPWWGSNPACIPKLWGHTGRAPCGLHVQVCQSQWTTRLHIENWPASSEWRAGIWRGGCRWVLKRETRNNQSVT